MKRRQIIWTVAIVISTIVALLALRVIVANHPHRHIYGSWHASSANIKGMPLNSRACLICGWRMYDLPSAEIHGR